MQENKITVVIPFWNSEDTLPFCIEGIFDQNLKPFQVILVDNKSSDQSSSIARITASQHPETFLYLLEERRGPSFARNTGLRYAKGDIIVFTDSDCVPHADWLNNLLANFTDLQVGAVAGRILSYQSESLLDKFHSIFTMQGSDQPEKHSQFTLVRGGFPTANLAVKKDILNQIDGFNESMMIYSEDYDLCARIYEAGYKIQYTPSAIVYHKHRNSLRGTWRQSFGFGKGHATALRKHFKRLVLIELPRFHYMSRIWPVRLWLHLSSADKKLLMLVLLSVMWLPLTGILVLYFLFLFRKMTFQVEQSGLKASFFEKWWLVLLLIFKSAAISTGRLVGSFRNKVFCF